MKVPPPWLRPILTPLSLLYAGSIALHRGFYRFGILRSDKLPKPVVSVGNLTAGGGGKTPIVMWLAETLANRGVKPAILSRGYGREGGEILVVDREGPWSSFGDEPAMMAGRLTDVPVVVSVNRRLAGLELLKHRDVDLFILDDGFQHYALERDFDIVVVDDHRRFGNGRLLPAGVLREPVSRLQHADFIIVTKAQHVDSEFEKYIHRYSPAQVLWADYQPAGLTQVGSCDASVPGGESAGSFVAFCGIAVPEGFRQTLERANIEVAELLTFPDHHPYTAADADRIVETAFHRQAAGIVTTEKDAIRWPRRKMPLPLYYLEVQPEVLEEKDLIKSLLALVSESGGVG